MLKVLIYADATSAERTGDCPYNERAELPNDGGSTVSKMLNDLWATLDVHAEKVPIEELTAMLGRLELTADDVRGHVHFNPDHYCRNLLHCGVGYCALILCWRPGQASPIHDHRGSGCAVRVLEGTASEIKYDRGPGGELVEAARNSYPQGHVCGSWDEDVHVMFNDQPAGRNLVTLHVYTPPLREVHIYSEEGDVQTWTDELSCAAQARVLAGTN
jgi:cysteine dioxygenase